MGCEHTVEPWGVDLACMTPQQMPGAVIRDGKLTGEQRPHVPSRLVSWSVWLACSQCGEDAGKRWGPWKLTEELQASVGELGLVYVEAPRG